MNMSMSMSSTSSAAMASSTGMSMGGMGGGMDMGGACKISMLWNWYTIDACFLASSWHITSSGMFAGSCIGVVLLVMVLELLRRTAAEYDGYISRKASAEAAYSNPRMAQHNDSSSTSSIDAPTKHTPLMQVQSTTPAAPVKPTITEQAIRSLLHMATFAVAYFVMLLAMYFNGYIIICIFIGAFLGFFVFHWRNLGSGKTSATQEPTFCCG